MPDSIVDFIATVHPYDSLKRDELARVEGVVTVRRLLDRLRDISIDESVHGPARRRNYVYEPTFLLRGLTSLHIEFTPID